MSDCWHWEGWTVQGYGKLQRNGKTVSAHRLMYETFVGPIMEGLCIMHTCDNRSCVNPTHLRVGTWADNNRDRAAKGRNGVRTFNGKQMPEYCKKGHLYDENTIRYRRRGNGRLGLYCRTCNTDGARRYYRERRG